MANKIFRPFVEKLGNAFANTYVGNAGDIFYDPDERQLRISDGTTAGGNNVGFGPTTATFNSALANTNSAIALRATIAGPTFTGVVNAPTVNVTSALAFSGTALTTSVGELNTFDKSLTRDASTSDMASPALTKNLSTFTNVVTLDGNLADDGRTADLVITNSLVTATSVIIASANVDVRVEPHTVIAGSFRASFHNTSGSQINNDTNFKVNYMVL